MSNWYRKFSLSFVATLGLLMIAGCAGLPGQVSPAQAVDQLRSGLPLLACREACAEQWRAALPRAANLAATGQWPELAALLVNVGYQDDLTLYYLGRAAEGVGYPGAAASYYRQSTYVSNTSQACRLLSGNCGGLRFPPAALQRIAVIDRQLNRSAPRRASPGRPQPALTPAETVALPPEQAAPAAATGAPIPLDGTTALAAPENAAPPQTPPPTPITAGATGADFIEPPAAPTPR
jgi:hypothetical protein